LLSVICILILRLWRQLWRKFRRQNLSPERPR